MDAKFGYKIPSEQLAVVEAAKRETLDGAWFDLSSGKQKL